MTERAAALRRRLGESGALVLGSVAAALLGLLGLRFLLRGLSEEDFGRYVLFQVVGGLLVVPLSWSIPAVLRLGAEEMARRGRLLGTAGAVGALALASAALVLPAFAWAEPHVEAWLGAPLGGVALAYAAATTAALLAAALLQPAGEVRWRTLVPAASRGLQALALGGLLAGAALTLERAAWIAVVTALPAIALPLWVARAALAPPAPGAPAAAPALETARRAARFGAPLVVRNLGLAGLLYVDVLVLAHWEGPVAAGRYEVAYRVAEQAIVFGFVLDFVSGPPLAAAAARGDEGAVRRFAREAVPPLALAWGVLAALLVALARPLLHALGAPSVEASAPVLELLALAVALRGVSLLEGPLLDAHLLSAWPTAFLLAALGLNLALDVALLEAGWGLVGPAWATLAAFGLHAALRAAYLGRALGAPTWRGLVALGPPALVLGLGWLGDASGVAGAGGLARALGWPLAAGLALAFARARGWIPPEVRDVGRDVVRDAALALAPAGRGRAGLAWLLGPGAEGRAEGRGAPPAAPGGLAAGADPLPRTRPGDDRVRLLLLVTELRPAGAERVVRDLALGLDPARWRVVVASLTSPGGDDGAVARDLRAAGLEVVCLRARGPLAPGTALRLVRLVRGLRPHVLHAHLFHANLAARTLGRLAGARRVVSTHHVVERRRLPVRALLERLTARLDDRTVCVSAAVAAHARAALGAPRARLRVVPNGVDLARFAAPPAGADGQGPGGGGDRDARRAAARAHWGLEGPGPWLGAVARLDRQKGLDVLLAALARLRPARPDLRLALAGWGPEEGALRAQADALDLAGAVRFLGYVDDVPGLLAALDVLCLPSRWEGFGLAAVEGLAAGLPLVASRVDSLPEVVGDAGLLVPPDDAVALAQALARVLDDPALRADLAARGPARAARFDRAAMLAGYARVYREVLGPGPARTLGAAPGPGVESRA